MFDPKNPFHRENSPIGSPLVGKSPSGQYKLPQRKKPKEELLFEGKGVSRSDFKKALESVPYEKAKLYRHQRIEINEEMKMNPYGAKIDEKDIKKYKKGLRRQEELKNPREERDAVQRKENLIEILKKFKKF